jgi:restriction system protein
MTTPARRQGWSVAGQTGGFMPKSDRTREPGPLFRRMNFSLPNSQRSKAVQEIAAARSHYSVDYAVVVSKSDYTNAARQLAGTNKVFLIHHDDIPELFAMLQEENDEPSAAPARSPSGTHRGHTGLWHPNGL